jgi:cytochrome c oxidase subunit II
MMQPRRSRGGRWRRARVFALVGLLGLVALACAENAPQDALDPAGEYAREPDKLWNLVFYIAVAIFIIVEAVLVYAVVKFRHKPDRHAAQFHGNTKLEVLLTAIPAIILAGIAIPTVGQIFDLSEEPEGDFIEVTVQGRQFWWRYDYGPLGVVSANELHIPVDTEVRLRLDGYDVVHNFWVPRLAGGEDVIPGRTNFIRLKADEPGVYSGQCKEFCGPSHSRMRIKVFADTQEDFDRWVEEQSAPAQAEPAGSLEQEGAEIFANQCTACHAIDGTENAPEDDSSLAGPNLTHFASRTTFAGAIFENTPENLRDWIDNPPAMKPGARMPDYGLSSEEIDAVVAYLQTLE